MIASGSGYPIHSTLPKALDGEDCHESAKPVDWDKGGMPWAYLGS